MNLFHRPHETHGQAAEEVAWLFYSIAALGSSIGQIWVGVTVAPWPDSLSWGWRAALVAPFAIVIDLGGVVTSAFADARMRQGEAAYSWRMLSAASIIVAVGINILGHVDVPYLAAGFGFLGVFAYFVWLGHSAARRRDALRAAGKLGDTAPVYGLLQWKREPQATRLAKSLALEHGYSLHESLSAAREQLRTQARRAALATHIETLIRSRHHDPVRADIAATTLPLDALAAQVTANADVDGWARAIAADLTPPPAADTDPQSGNQNLPLPQCPGADVLRRVPSTPADYNRWRELWHQFKAELAANPKISSKSLADRHAISARQVQWIRKTGEAGLLDSPIPLVLRLIQMEQQDSTAKLAISNGHLPHHRVPVS